MIGGKSFSLTLHEFEDGWNYIWSNPRFNPETWYDVEDRLVARIKQRFWTARWRHNGDDWQELHFAELTTLLNIMDKQQNEAIEKIVAAGKSVFNPILPFADEFGCFPAHLQERIQGGWYLSEIVSISLVNPRLNERTSSQAIKWMIEGAKNRLRRAIGLDKEVKT